MSYEYGPRVLSGRQDRADENKTTLEEEITKMEQRTCERALKKDEQVAAIYEKFPGLAKLVKIDPDNLLY
jgi:hypothetical protein